MHYNESTDKMNKEKRTPTKKYTFLLNYASYCIIAGVIGTMSLYFFLKDKYFGKLPESKELKTSDFLKTLGI